MSISCSLQRSDNTLVTNVLSEPLMTDILGWCVVSFKVVTAARCCCVCVCELTSCWWGKFVWWIHKLMFATKVSALGKYNPLYFLFCHPYICPSFPFLSSFCCLSVLELSCRNSPFRSLLFFFKFFTQLSKILTLHPFFCHRFLFLGVASA